ncbi:tetratricopeptide repeat protein [Treponema sp.]|uniref:tetratricopeptide repeat protein n=1 Tax=Treponema sp. TaxID=166 RepID=UPI0025D6255E|nr:tetratricopeptide repeat protein [Treponema sp.]
MIVIAVSLILLVLIGFLGVFVIKSLAAPKKLDAINRLIKQQKYTAAQKAAKSLIAKDPHDYHAHYYLGKAYLADHKNELALMEFKSVAQNAIFDAQLPEIEFRKQLSQLFLKFNQLDDALKEFLLLTRL